LAHRFPLAVLSCWAFLLTANAVSGHAAAGTLEEVGRHDLGARGMNSALAIADHCAYIGSRGDAPSLILDIADPAAPRLVGELAGKAGSTSRELRADPALHLLVVMHYALRGQVNALEFYRWTDDCTRPTLAGRHDLGGRAPHEFYLWHDPQRSGRVLVLVTTRTAKGSLEVVDVSDPVHPLALATWDLPPGLPQGAYLHSIALSPDGRTAYLSLWTGGLALGDTSDFAAGAAHPQVRLLTTSANMLRYLPGNVHSAVPVPGRALALTTDEQYGGCPFGWARLVDVGDPSRPRLAGLLQVEENDPLRCRSAAGGTWTSHNATVTAHLAVLSWYSAGLLVFETEDAQHPTLLAQARPAGVTPGQRDPLLGAGATMTWSYPVIRDGLLYAVDINQGLRIWRYHGPHEEELSALAFAEGNSNLSRGQSAVASASGPTPSPAPDPVLRPSSPTPSPHPVAGALRIWWLLGSLVAAGMVGVLGVALLVRLRR
jgi:hypothetical protein